MKSNLTSPVPLVRPRAPAETAATLPGAAMRMPTELWALVLDHGDLHPIDLVKAGQTCRILHAVSKCNRYWVANDKDRARAAEMILQSPSKRAEASTLFYYAAQRRLKKKSEAALGELRHLCNGYYQPKKYETLWSSKLPKYYFQPRWFDFLCLYARVGNSPLWSDRLDHPTAEIFQHSVLANLCANTSPGLSKSSILPRCSEDQGLAAMAVRSDFSLLAGIAYPMRQNAAVVSAAKLAPNFLATFVSDLPARQFEGDPHSFAAVAQTRLLSRTLLPAQLRAVDAAQWSSLLFSLPALEVQQQPFWAYLGESLESSTFDKLILQMAVTTCEGKGYVELAVAQARTGLRALNDFDAVLQHVPEVLVPCMRNSGWQTDILSDEDRRSKTLFSALIRANMDDFAAVVRAFSVSVFGNHVMTTDWVCRDARLYDLLPTELRKDPRLACALLYRFRQQPTFIAGRSPEAINPLLKQL